MSAIPSSSTSHSKFESIFSAALKKYNRKTKQDLAKHPLLPRIQSCGSPEAILAVLREQYPEFDQSQNRDDGLTNWITPTVNVLYSFSATLGAVVGLAFPPANIIFTGIGVLLLASKDVRASRDKLFDLFNSIGRFFQRLAIYTDITPTAAMTDIIVDIMVEVFTILAIAMKEVKCGRLKKYLRKLLGNTDIEDSLQRLDRLTQDEAQMAAAESQKVTHDVGAKVIGVDDRVRGVGDKVEDVQDDVQDVGNKVGSVDRRVQAIQGDVHNVGNKVEDVDHSVQIIGSDVKDISSDVREVNRNQLYESFLRWLSPSDPSINHNVASEAHHNGTAQWFSQGDIYSRWKSTGSLLWIHGKPGSGKSILCSSIIQDIMALRDAGTASMAYFYFDFRDVDKQRLHNLLPSLLIQLAPWSDPCFDILSRLYSTHGRGTQRPSNRVMVECLKEMLNHNAQGPTYIILDALDECPKTSTIPPPRDKVLDFVGQLVGLQLPNLHLCVTSRPEPDIQAVLEPLTARPVSLHDESGQREDIANYVASVVGSDRRARRWRKEDRDLVIMALTEKADGMFLWAFCQLEILLDCLPPSIQHTLSELPDSLDGTYERILREIRKPNQRPAHRLMQCLVAAVRPLQVKELAEVLALNFDAEVPKLNTNWRWEDQEGAIMLACSSLVTIVKDGDSRIVQFSHFSVKEFLTADRLAVPIRDVSLYHIELEAAHTILTRACIGFLLRLDDQVDRDNIKDFPLTRYAAEYWPQHAKFGSVSTRISDGMECLFDEDKPHFAMWLWIYDEMDGRRRLSTMRPEKPGAVPLCYAARLGLRDLATQLIAEHPEHVYARGLWGRTAMHAAAIGENADILSLLLEHDADVDSRDEHGNTSLHWAACYGALGVGRCLLDHGADINARDHVGRSPLYFAAYHGDAEFAQMLLERGAVIDAPNDQVETLLHQAAQRNNIEVARLLLDHGADIDAHDNAGRTPLICAKLFGSFELAQMLRERGAVIDASRRFSGGIGRIIENPDFSFSGACAEYERAR